jgi:hypothetical protein
MHLTRSISSARLHRSRPSAAFGLLGEFLIHIFAFTFGLQTAIKKRPDERTRTADLLIMSELFHGRLQGSILFTKLSSALSDRGHSQSARRGT